MGMVFYSIDIEMRPTKVGIKYPKIASLDVSHFVASTTTTTNLQKPCPTPTNLQKPCPTTYTSTMDL